MVVKEKSIGDWAFANELIKMQFIVYFYDCRRKIWSLVKLPLRLQTTWDPYKLYTITDVTLSTLCNVCTYIFISVVFIFSVFQFSQPTANSNEIWIGLRAKTECIRNLLHDIALFLPLQKKKCFPLVLVKAHTTRHEPGNVITLNETRTHFSM